MSESMRKLCVCEICDCGRHRCPHKPAALYWQDALETCTMTEYTEQFPFHTGATIPTQSLKPRAELDWGADCGKMEGATTFRTDYLPHEVQRRPARQPVEYKPSPEKIDLETTYNQTFKPNEIQPYAPARPKQKSHVVKDKMETVPTYKDCFKQWEISKRQSTKPEQSYQPPSSRFQGTTTFQDDFVPKAVAPRQSCKPPAVAQHSAAPFGGVTSHQASFVPQPMPPRYARPREAYKPSSEPLEALTTCRENFQGLPGEPPQSCKPSPNKASALGEADTPFQGSTESRDRFTEWPVSVPQLRKSEEYVSPTEKMELSTTTGMYYVRHPVQPFVPARRHLPHKRFIIPFQGCSTMRDDFQAWGTKARQPIIRKSEEMRKSSGKMEDITTFRAHFIPHAALRPSKSFKPPGRTVRSSVPMEDSTMYRIEFTPKRLSACPASFQLPPGYAFEESDERGHRFFRKLPSATPLHEPRPVTVLS